MLKKSVSKGLHGFMESCAPCFPLDGISTDFLVVAKKNDNLAVLKGKITRVVNSLEDGCKRFKIGKSGVPKSRFANYGNYSRMVLLCQSRCESIIETLEAYYNCKYRLHPKCDNINAGSASDMADGGSYFLYVVFK